MIEPSELLDQLEWRGYDAAVYVADSVLAALLDALDKHPGLESFGANNEGEALAIAAGIALAGGRPVLLLQNSGIGNLLNPLVSLSDPMRVPVLMIVGWRGQPGRADEPQHAQMGAVTADLLALVGVTTLVAGDGGPDVEELLDRADEAFGAGRSCAILVPPGALGATMADRSELAGGAALSRTEALGAVLAAAPAEAAVIATTGYTARELFALSDRPQQLYLTGSMGCAASVGLGVSWRRPGPVVVLDGDGAALMRLEAMVSIGARRPGRLLHVLLDNGVHDSTGGQPTQSARVDFPAVARAVGYSTALSVGDADELGAAVGAASVAPGPHFLHVRTRPGAPSGLGRISLDPAAVASRFARYLRSGTARSEGWA